jgi:hypothetical protein
LLAVAAEDHPLDVWEVRETQPYEAAPLGDIGRRLTGLAAVLDESLRGLV